MNPAGMQLRRPLCRAPRGWLSLSLRSLLAWTCLACVTTTTLPPSAGQNADDLLIVDCLLPSKVRQLGSALTYLEPRRPIKTNAADCQIRGGEYTAYDRASYATALGVWRSKAEAGDPVAELYVGEIYEKGLGRAPDYGLAAFWYERAAKQGNAAAQINLGQLYELGRGVERDPAKALEWYRRASGLEGQVGFVASGDPDHPTADDPKVRQLQRELESQSEEVQRLRAELARLRRELEESRRPGVSGQAEQADRIAKERTLEAGRAELARLDQELAEKARALASRTAQLESREGEVDAKRHEVDRLTLRLAELRKQEREFQGKRAELAALDREIAQLSEERDQVGRGKQAEIVRLDDEIGRLAARAGDMDESTEAIEQQRAELNRLRREMAEVSEQRSQAVRAKEREIAGLNGQISELRRQLSRLGAEEKELDRRTADLARLESELSQLNAERETAGRSALAEQERQNAEIARVNDSLTQKLSLLAEQERKVEGKRGELSRIEGEIERLARDRSQMAAAKQREIERLNAEIADLGSKAQGLEAQRAELEGLRSEIASLKSEKNRLRTQGKADQVAMAGPTIEMLDPTVVRQRGMSLVRTAVVDVERLVVGRVVAPAGLTSLTVNDEELEVTDNGLFEARIRVSREGSPVRVAAVDRQGKSDVIQFVLDPGDDTPPVAAAPRLKRSLFGNYYALVIGNNAYTQLQPLRTPRKDAEVVSRVLEDSYGFRVTTLYDASRYQIMDALNELRKKLTSEDNLLIYYAGHGELDEANQRGNWLPVDAEPESSANWISNVSLTDVLNQMAAKHILVVADSCYSGTLTRASLARLEAGTTTSERMAWITQMAKTKSRTALTSGAIAPVMDGGSRSGHSVFARALLDVLRENDQVMEGQSLYLRIAARVTHAAGEQRFEQLPQYAPIRHGGHESGDFFFVPVTGS